MIPLIICIITTEYFAILNGYYQSAGPATTTYITDKMEEFISLENKLMEIERYKNRLRTDYSTSIKCAAPNTLRGIEIAINGHALRQYQEHQDRIQTGSIRVSDGL